MCIKDTSAVIKRQEAVRSGRYVKDATLYRMRYSALENSLNNARRKQNEIDRNLARLLALVGIVEAPDDTALPHPIADPSEPSDSNEQSEPAKDSETPLGRMLTAYYAGDSDIDEESVIAAIKKSGKDAPVITGEMVHLVVELPSQRVKKKKYIDTAKRVMGGLMTDIETVMVAVKDSDDIPITEAVQRYSDKDRAVKIKEIMSAVWNKVHEQGGIPHAEV